MSRSAIDTNTEQDEAEISLNRKSLFLGIGALTFNLICQLALIANDPSTTLYFACICSLIALACLGWLAIHNKPVITISAAGVTPTNGTVVPWS